MNDITRSELTRSITDRAKSILLKPKETWPAIEAEQRSMGEIFVRYAMPLAAIGPVAGFIGSQVFGYGAFGFSYRPSFMGALGTMVVGYVLSLIGLVLVTLVADFLAPKFDGTADRTRAFKLVAYSYTAAWVVGIFGLIPMLGFLGLLGLYSLYLFYTGAPTMMKVPQDKAVGYTAVVVLVGIVLSLILGALTATLTGGMGAAAGAGASRSVFADNDEGGTISIPGVGTIDTAEMERTAERMEKMSTGEIKPTAPDELANFLPESIGPFQRTALSKTAAGPMGSSAEGTYENGEQRFDLTVSDIAALGGFAAMGSAFGVEQSREDQDGFERIGKVDGAWRSEKWSNSRGSGNYGTIIADRFMVEADGKVASHDMLKAAVSAVDTGRLEGMAED